MLAAINLAMSDSGDFAYQPDKDWKWWEDPYKEKPRRRKWFGVEKPMQ
jgi:hypothetical protein